MSWAPCGGCWWISPISAVVLLAVNLLEKKQKAGGRK